MIIQLTGIHNCGNSPVVGDIVAFKSREPNYADRSEDQHKHGKFGTSQEIPEFGILQQFIEFTAHYITLPIRQK